MTTPYVAGPALIYVGLPTNLSALAASLGKPKPPVKKVEITAQQFGDNLDKALALNNIFFNNPNFQMPAPAPFVGPPEPPKVPPKPPLPRPQPIPASPSSSAFAASVLRVMTPVYLGTCEDSPVPDFQPASVPFFVDEFGQTYPFDTLYDSAEATVALTLNVFNENVHALLRGYCAGGALNTAAPGGSDLDGYIGTAMGAEGATVPLWLVFPYSQKDWLAAAGLPPCYRFYSCRLLSHGLRDLSCKPKKVQMVFRAQRFCVPGLGAFLYDHDPTGLPDPD